MSSDKELEARGDPGSLDAERPRDSVPITPEIVVPLVHKIVRQQFSYSSQSSGIDTEAIAQEVSLSVLDSLKTFPEHYINIRRLEGYIYVAARRRYYDAWRRRVREPLLSEMPDYDSGFADIHAGAAFDWAELRAAVERINQDLIGRDDGLATTIALLMEYEFALPLATLADIRKISLPTASRERARALVFLRRKLNERET